jgi:hypothetical protein
MFFDFDDIPVHRHELRGSDFPQTFEFPESPNSPPMRRNSPDEFDFDALPIKPTAEKKIKKVVVVSPETYSFIGKKEQLAAATKLGRKLFHDEPQVHLKSALRQTNLREKLNPESFVEQFPKSYTFTKSIWTDDKKEPLESKPVDKPQPKQNHVQRGQPYFNFVPESRMYGATQGRVHEEKVWDWSARPDMMEFVHYPPHQSPEKPRRGHCEPFSQPQQRRRIPSFASMSPFFSS